MKKLFASMTGNKIDFTICIYCGHIFRRYPNGKITKATAEDLEAARMFKYL